VRELRENNWVRAGRTAASVRTPTWPLAVGRKASDARASPLRAPTPRLSTRATHDRLAVVRLGSTYTLASACRRPCPYALK
jgi:hypothetical protein